MIKERKKIIGLILFALLISLIFGYPTLQGFYLEGKVESLISNGQYKEAYEILAKRDYDISTSSYINKLICEFELGKAGFDIKLDMLIKDNEVEIVQEIVDRLGERLGRKLMKIHPMEGVFLDGDANYILANIYYEQYKQTEDTKALDKAMELRGSRYEIDFIYISYYLEQKEYHKLLLEDELIPSKIKEEYYRLMSEELIRRYFWGKFSKIDSTNERMAFVQEYISFLESLPFPDGIMETLSLTLLDLEYSVSLNYVLIEVFNQIHNSPLFRENIYFTYHKLINQLDEYKNTNKVIQELKEMANKNESYKIEGLEEIITLLEIGIPIIYPQQVTKSGILMAMNWHGDYLFYDLEKEKQLNISFNHRINENAYSKGRKFFIAFNYSDDGSWKEYYTLFDSNLNFVKDFGDVLNKTWLDDNRLVYMESNGKWRMYDAKLNTLTDYLRGSITPINITPLEKTSLVWSMDEEKYTAIEYDEVEGKNKEFYVIRNNTTKEIIYKYPLDFEFLGDDSDNIYGLKSIGKRFLTIVAVNKNTLENKIYPYYVIQSHMGGQY